MVHTHSEARLTTSRLAKHLSAAAAEDNRLRVREHRGDSEATRALDVHEERVGVLNQTLELVAALLLLLRRVYQINRKSLERQRDVLKQQRHNVPYCITVATMEDSELESVRKGNSLGGGPLLLAANNKRAWPARETI